MKNKNVMESFNHAIFGIVRAVKTERNLRTHLFFGTFTFILGYYLKISKIEFAVLSIVVFLVIAAELINTALEYAMDSVVKEYNLLVKYAKDISAGAVFVTAINAVIVGLLIFGDKLLNITLQSITHMKYFSPYIAFAILCIVLFITVLLKIYVGKGTPMKGGLPSGHSALGFSIATIISYLVDNGLVIALSYILATIVAQSRVDGKIHSVLEVIIGAALGTIVTVLLLNILIIEI